MLDAVNRNITYLRISVTELCSLRCRYCMPAEGIFKKRHDEMLTEDELITLIGAAASLGITKLRLTGGEPLVKRNILSICRRAAMVPGIEDLRLTTNGQGLDELALPLRQAGVRALNISLDTLDAQRYRYITRVGSLENFMRGFHAALGAGFERIKLNTVLIGGFNDDEIPALAALTLKYPVDVRFIELMPMYDGGDFGPSAFIPGSEVLRRLPNARPEADDGGVAKLYRLDGALGRIGLISPVSTPFCSSCNRIRVTADGMVKPCLHTPAEFPLKGLDYEGMREQLMRAIMSKPQWHGELSALHRSRAGRAMNEIGG